jgi:hypothetical protein
VAKQPPLIRYDSLAGEWVVLTRYTNKGTHIMAHTGYKYDVTEQIDAIAMPIVEQRDALLEALKDLTHCLSRNRAGIDAKENIRKAYDKALDAITKAEEGST